MTDTARYGDNGCEYCFIDVEYPAPWCDLKLDVNAAHEFTEATMNSKMRHIIHQSLRCRHEEAGTCPIYVTKHFGESL